MLQRIESLLRIEPYSTVAAAIFLLFFGAFLYAKSESKIGPVLIIFAVVLLIMTLEANRIINLY